METQRQKSQISKVGLIILGLGHQGQRVAAHFGRIRDAVREHGISLELVGLKDINPANLARGKAALPKDVQLKIQESTQPLEGRTDSPDPADILANALNERVVPLSACIVYDATDSQLHYRHLRRVADFQRYYNSQGKNNRQFFLYFGEKPIFPLTGDNYLLPPASVRHALAEDLHFCNFGEIRNPAFLTLLDNIRDVVPREIRFWRTNTVAAERLVLGARGGVTGGSFLDKSIHDLSLTLAILAGVKPKRKLQLENVHDVSAEVEWLMPAWLSPNPTETEEFLSIDGKLGKVSSTSVPAEAAVTIRARFGVDNKTDVLLSYSSSWLGLTTKQTAELATIMDRFPHYRATARGQVPPNNLVPGFGFEDTRIIYLRGSDRKRKSSVELLANLLESSSLDLPRGATMETSVSRCVAIRRNEQVPQRLELKANQYVDAFGDMFTEVIRVAASPEKAVFSAMPPGINHESSAEIHGLAMVFRQEIDRAVADAGRDVLLQKGRRRVLQLTVVPHCFLEQR